MTQAGASTRALMPNSVSCRAFRWRSRPGHFACVSGSRVGIAQRSQGCSRRSSSPPSKRSVRPSHAVSAQAGASSDEMEVGAEAAQVELGLELAGERRAARLEGDEHGLGQVLDAAHVALQPHRTPELGAECLAQAGVVPAELAPVGRGELRERGIAGPDLAVERVACLPREQPRRLARGERLDAALVLVEHRVRAVAADPALVEPQHGQALAAHRLHGPAPELENLAGGHLARA